jgi:hypothetical protein
LKLKKQNYFDVMRNFHLLTKEQINLWHGACYTNSMINEEDLWQEDEKVLEELVYTLKELSYLFYKRWSD